MAASSWPPFSLSNIYGALKMQQKKRYQFSLADQIAGGKIQGRRTLKNKTGIHGMTPEQKREASSQGGVTQGKIQCAANVASGQIERIRIES